MNTPRTLASHFRIRLVFLTLAVAVPGGLVVGFLLSWPAALASGALVLLVMGALMVGLAQGFQTRIQAPLEALELTAVQWRHERLDARAGLGAVGEFGRVGTALDEMAAHLEAVFARLTVKTRTDLVTGLPSRAQLLLDITLARRPVLVLVNVDSFKEINDSYGNRAGDEVLKQLAAVLETFHAAFHYRLYKMPADEFALLFDMEIEEAEVAALTGALAEKVTEAQFIVDETPIHIRVTSGVAMGRGAVPVPDRGAWPYLVAHADMALKKAKASMRPFLIFHESMEIQREFEQNLYWKNTVKQALLDDRIIAYFQPITCNKTDEVQKFESLVRLRTPDQTIHLPADFLDIARRSHFDGHITKAMVTQAFAAFDNQLFEFSINLTVRDMLSPEICQFLHSKIEAHPETARRLVVEILESEGIENYRDVKLFLAGIKAAGVKVAIDDFGSGYSNFDHILKLDVDYIKLDASLISNIDTDRNAQIIVKTIVGFSKELGLKTIAEHVHTKEVLEMTKELGVDFSQGFYLGRPGPREGLL